jgi:hypothetical protein
VFLLEKIWKLLSEHTRSLRYLEKPIPLLRWHHATEVEKIITTIFTSMTLHIKRGTNN